MVGCFALSPDVVAYFEWMIVGAKNSKFHSSVDAFANLQPINFRLVVSVYFRRKTNGQSIISTNDQHHEKSFSRSHSRNQSLMRDSKRSVIRLSVRSSVRSLVRPSFGQCIHWAALSLARPFLSEMKRVKTRVSAPAPVRGDIVLVRGTS